MTRVSFKVTVDLPENCSIADMAQYIREEVDSGGGNRDPADPLFNKKNTEVVYIKKTPPGVRGRWA